MKSILLYLLFVLAAMSVVVGPAWTQGNITAGMRGTITDPTGAVVPKAKVTITNVNTQLTQATTASNTGIYTFTLLPVGTYRLRVVAPGFKTYEQSDIPLAVNQVLGLNVTLTLGAVTEKVEVTGGAPLVNTQTTEVGTLIGTRDIVELPLNTRNPVQLAALGTGISQEGISLTMTGPPDARMGSTGGASNMSVDGLRVTLGQYLLEGTEFSTPADNEAPNYPNPDALEEFRFISSNYSAEFGKNPGGVLNAIIKSGTNSVHGSVWEFNRNSALGARNFFLPSVAFLNQNQYGFSAGGPIKKNKLFVFGTYQGLRIAQGRTSTSQYPINATEAQGNLANNSLNQHPKQITDPLHPLATDPLHNFVGNIIPANRIDHVANVYNTLIPGPNSPDGRWLGTAAEPYTSYQWMPKVDWNVSDRQRFSSSYFRDHSTASSRLDFGRLTLPFNAPPATGDIPRHTINNTKDFIASHVFSFRPSLMNQFRFAVVHLDWSLTNVKRGPTLRDMGATFPDTGAGLDIPGINVTGRWSQSGGNFAFGHMDSDEWTDNLNYIRGRHSVKMGVQIRNNHYFVQTTGNGAGAWGSPSFNGSQTADPVGDYLLGMGNMYVSNSLMGDNYQHGQAAYFQDDLRATRRLTLNLGVRWEQLGEWVPKATIKLTDGTYMSPASVFVPAAFYSNTRSSIITTAPPGMMYPGDPGVTPGIIPTQGRFEPRVGLAWDVTGDGRTSVRAGAGFFTTSPLGENTTTELYSPPFFVNYNVPVTPSMMNPLTPAAAAAFPPIYSRTINMTPYQPLNVEGADLNMHNGSVYQWNLTLQHQFPGSIAVSAGWVANVAHHLMEALDKNNGVYIPGNDPVTGLPLSTVAIDPALKECYAAA